MHARHVRQQMDDVIFCLLTCASVKISCFGTGAGESVLLSTDLGVFCKFSFTLLLKYFNTPMYVLCFYINNSKQDTTLGIFKHPPFLIRSDWGRGFKLNKCLWSVVFGLRFDNLLNC